MTNGSRKVLIVEDDPAAAEGLERALSEKGYGVDSVASGEDALWRLEHGGYEAVFAAVELRGMNGLEVAEEIQARQLGVPIALQLDAQSPTIDARASAAGVAEVVRGPAAAGKVVEIVERIAKPARAAAAQPSVPADEAAKPGLAGALSERLRSIVLFLSAPFVALAYIVLFPLIGFGALIWFAITAKSAPAEGAPSAAPAPTSPKPSLVKTVGMIIALVVIGFAFGIVGPIVGIGVVIWFAFEAWGRLGAKVIETGREG